VLLDTDAEGNTAREKIKTQYLDKLAEDQNNRFRIFMLGKAAGIKKTDAGIEDIFPDEFYLECVNAAFRVAINIADLPQDGSDMITKRVEHVLKTRYDHKALDKDRVFAQMLRRFDQWDKVDDLPGDAAARAAELFATINRTFAGG
jgi:hypothetical protein